VNNLKDPVETKLHAAVCANKITLAAAQKAINGSGDGWDNMTVFNWTGHAKPNIRWTP
jgi:hypothetical protein